MDHVDFGPNLDPALIVFAIFPPPVAWALFQSNYGRPDRGAWTGTGLFLAALMPALIGLGWTLFRFRGAMEHVLSTGMSDGAWMAGGAAEALATTAFGFWASALIVASMFVWIRQFTEPTSGESMLPGTWLLGGGAGAVLLAQGGVLLIAMCLTARYPDADAARALIRLVSLGLGALAILAFASIRHAPRGREAPRRAHVVVAGTLALLLAAAGTLTWVAVEHFVGLATTGSRPPSPWP